MESAVATPAVPKSRSGWRPQVSLFSALILMVLLAVIVGLGVKIYDLQERNRALELERDNIQMERDMLQYAMRKLKTL
jgi:hypothetical protein